MRRMLVGLALALASLTASAAGPPAPSVTITNTPLPVTVVDAPEHVLDLSDVQLHLGGYTTTCWATARAEGPGTSQCETVLPSYTSIVRTVIYRKLRPDSGITEAYGAARCEAAVSYAGADGSFRYFGTVSSNADSFESRTEVLPVPIRLPAASTRRVAVRAFGPEGVMCGYTIGGFVTYQ